MSYSHKSVDGHHYVVNKNEFKDGIENYQLHKEVENKIKGFKCVNMNGENVELLFNTKLYKKLGENLKNILKNHKPNKEKEKLKTIEKEENKYFNKEIKVKFPKNGFYSCEKFTKTKSNKFVSKCKYTTNYINEGEYVIDIRYKLYNSSGRNQTVVKSLIDNKTLDEKNFKLIGVDDEKQHSIIKKVSLKEGKHEIEIQYLCNSKEKSSKLGDVSIYYRKI